MPPAPPPPRSRADTWFGDTNWGLDPNQRDPVHLAEVVGSLARIYGPHGWFGLEVSGWAHVPPAPAYIVSNHSGGTSIPDVWGLMVAWTHQFGVGRPVHPLAHDMVFSVPSVARWFARLGVLRAAPGMGFEVLTRYQRDLFVCPGGDRETWRPWKDRYKLKFSGRTGYARLALRAGVPILPVAHVGAQHSLVVLTDGARLARTLHLPQLFRAEVFPVHLSLPWGLAVGPWPHLPLPVTLRYRIGPVVPFPVGAHPGEEPSDTIVAAYDVAVREAIQRELDALHAAEKPVAERLRGLARRASRAAPAAGDQPPR